jgi:hypothetical protein
MLNTAEMCETITHKDRIQNDTETSNLIINDNTLVHELTALFEKLINMPLALAVRNKVWVLAASKLGPWV